MNLPIICEKFNYLKELNWDNFETIKVSKDEDAKIVHKSADTNFFGYKTHKAINEERLVSAAVITSGEKDDGYNAAMMLEVILFAFTNQIYSLRKIEQVCKTDTRFIYLTNSATPYHRGFSRFTNSHLLNITEAIFYDINHSIIEIENIDADILSIDGTMFEANARKTSFV